MSDQKSGGAAKADRKARLAEQLRANLQKRKAQTRARRHGDADARPEGISAAGKADQMTKPFRHGGRLAALAFLEPGSPIV